MVEPAQTPNPSPSNAKIVEVKVEGKPVRDPNGRSFEAEVSNGILLLRDDLVGILKGKYADGSAERAFSRITSFPTEFALGLKWEVSEVKAATEELKTVLRGTVTDQILDWKPVARSYGARITRPVTP